MTATRTAGPQTASAELPPVPLTIEGYSVLHQVMRFRWQAWRQLRPTQKAEISDEAAQVLKNWEESTSGQSALFSVLGHKGDLMLVHFRDSFDELNRAEMQLSHLRLSDYLELATSYLSVIELGLYESSVKTYRELADAPCPGFLRFPGQGVCISRCNPGRGTISVAMRPFESPGVD